MNVRAANLNVRKVETNEFEGGGERNAELARRRSGADVVVSVGLHVGTKADGNAGRRAAGDRAHAAQFAFRFDVDPADARLIADSISFSVCRTPAKTMRAGSALIFRTRKVAAGDDVETRAFVFEQTEN